MSFEKLKEHVKEKFESEKRGAEHDFTHIERVLKNAEFIGKKEKANMKILAYAALLHDYIRDAEHEHSGNHALESSKAVRKILEKELSKEETDKVCDAIASHSRSSGVIPNTIEAKVLFDADKLDLSGPIGVMRWVCMGKEFGWTLETALEEYLKKAENGMKNKNWAYTKTGKKLVEKKMKEGITLCRETFRSMKK